MQLKLLICQDAAANPVNAYSEIPYLGDNLFLQYFEDGVGQEPGIFSINSGTFHLVKDINPGVSSAVPKCWARLKDKIYFLADDGTHGSEIWSTDGSLAGTSMLKHIAYRERPCVSNHF